MPQAKENLKAIGRITTKKSGGIGYNSYWIYIPSKIAKHDIFPFVNNDKVEIEITKEGKLLITKIDELKKIIIDYGLENATLPKVLEKKASINQNRPFLFFKEAIYSYKEVNALSNRIANGILKLLEDIGIRKSKALQRSVKISLMLPNCPEFIFCWFGIIKAKCIVVPINTELKGESLLEMLKGSDTEVLIIDYQFLNNYAEISDSLSRLKAIIILNAPSKFKFKSNYFAFEKVNSPNRENPNLNLKDFKRMEIFYTSGTTGSPKGLMFRNYYILTGINVGKEFQKIGLTQDSIIYCPLPLFHALGQLIGFFPTLFFNASIVIPEKFDIKTFWSDIKKYNVTGILYIGNYIKELINQPPSKSDRQHTVKWAFGLGISKDCWEAFENRFGIPIFEGWTLTEAVGITMNTVGSKGGKIGSIGKPVSGYEVKIVDKNGNNLPPGVNNIGQIVARSTIPIPLEYSKESGKKTVISNSWVETKDYGYKDNDGFYYYIGRESDIIYSQGETFFASEIEKIINTHPYVLECAAFGILRNNKSEEDVKLCVVLKRSGSISPEDLYDYMNQYLASFMVPRFIEIKEDLPKTITGFVQKFKLKKEWEDKLSQSNTWDVKIKSFIR